MVRTAFVSTYPPRQCGVAAFTAELARVTPDREIVALHPPERMTPYAMEVHHRIRRDERADYATIARSLERCADVAAIQLDPSIWGGDDGEWVLDFVAALRLPAVVTLHSLASRPTPRQRELFRSLVASVRALVVTSRAAASLATGTYGIDSQGIELIPYGTPDLPVVAPESIKPSLGLEGSDVILSMGLLGPEKGFERVIEALPAVLAAHPTAVYVVVGATHPQVASREGETYRRSLVALAESVGVARNVRFVPEFVGRNDLTRWLQAADVFVTPTIDLAKLASGPLTHAMAAGRAIVSTGYPYASELLADGRGTLVAGTPAALAAGIGDLLADPELRGRMGALAHQHSREMSWTRVGAAYQRLFGRVASAPPMPWGALVAPIATA